MPFRINPYTNDEYIIKIGKKEIKTKLRIINRILTRMKAGMSPIILIVGNQRYGKSFLACWLGYILMKSLGKEFSVKRNCIYTLEQAVELIDNTTKEVLIFDEMIGMGYKREFWKKEHFHLTKILNVLAYKQMIYIMILPMAKDLDSSFASQVELVLWTKKRGIVIVQKPRKNYTRFYAKDDYRVPYDKFSISMKAVPKEIWKDYKKYSFEMKQKINDVINDEILNSSRTMVKKTKADEILEFFEGN